MLTEFKLPGLGENIKSGLVTKIMPKLGDTISIGQSVVELETEKAVLEVPCSIAGVVKEILIKPGQEIKVGQVIIKIEADAAAVKVESKPQAPVIQETSQPAHKAAPKTETLSPAPRKPASLTPVIETAASFAELRKDVPAAPSVRRFAREIGIDIAMVPGSGPGGRISMDDVKAFAKQLNTAATRAIAGPAAVSLPDFSKWGEIDRQAMSMIRKTTSERLSQAWQAIPHVTQFDKADITELEKLRKKFSAKVEKAGGKLTITAFLLKVLASALKNFPQFNASIDAARNEIIYKKYCHIGVAVDTDRGLIVPVIRNVDQKGIVELAIELNQIAEKARTKKTTLEEMQGGTFTITNLGGIGGTSFTPIVNFPEVAILGISRAGMEQVYIDNHFVPRLMLPLSLSYDHRIIDGAGGARFMRWFVEALQQPFLMELGG